MLCKTFLLGLLTTPLTLVTASDSQVLSRQQKCPNQQVLGPAPTPAAPSIETITSGGILRTYGISVPSDYDKISSKQWPLIIDFHGRNSDILGQWNNSQYFLNPSGKEFIVVYPLGCYGNGTKGGPPERAWEGAPYANKSCDDILFISDLVKGLEQGYNINSARIYASGKSNGGGFVDTLACSPTGNLFAAFAMAAAALYTDTVANSSACAGSRPRIILEAHGTNDTTIPIKGRKDGSTPDIAQWARRWATRNGCDPSEDAIITHPNWGTNTTYTCSGPKNLVQQYRVEQLGHCWPSVTNNTDSRMRDGSCLVHTLDFTQAAVELFSAWPGPS